MNASKSAYLAAIAKVYLMILLTSKGMAKIPYLGRFLNADVSIKKHNALSAVAGWGRKKSGKLAKLLGIKYHVPCMLLEDGFLRSYGTGEMQPPMSLIVDMQGIYYDSTSASSIEVLLNSNQDVLSEIKDDVVQAKSLIIQHQLSKYNHAPVINPRQLHINHNNKVLVIDQTLGDMSVSLGGANAATFLEMLSAASNENPNATIYVKTHPEVSSGRKGGYLTDVVDNERTVVLRDAINPISLIQHMDKVYVVTSTMGFEALLLGRPVSVFGMPWYAGWGVTDDRQSCSRRTRSRSVDELFAAAYFHYTRYLNPITHQRGDIFDVINWLIQQKEMSAKYTGRMICVGFRRWKAANIKPLLALDQKRVIFVKDVKAAEHSNLQPEDSLIYWGARPPKGLNELAKKYATKLVRMEDGFIRSVGLGSDLIRPLSLVLDEQGIYFDPTHPSDLEHILVTATFPEEELRRAEHVRKFIVTHGITKYNMEARKSTDWDSGNKKVILVPGQVEDDASILHGTTYIKSNLSLLQKARESNPEAFIVYKPHPDVMSGNRLGKLANAQALKWADYIETSLSVVSCIDACSEVHTMTSLTGFDALLRGKKVVVYGEPFYAGWGLTEDVYKDGIAFQRRKRQLTLDELVAGTLLRYPIYWDWDLKGYTTCEAVLNRILETRDKLESSGGIEKLRIGYVRRQLRKLSILFSAWINKI